MGTPYQKHSHTSREAAEKHDAKSLRQRVYDALNDRGQKGACVDRISQSLKVPAGTLSARMIELERMNMVIKTNMVEKTRYNRNASVYVTSPYWSHEAGKAATKKESTHIDNELLDSIVKDLETIWMVKGQTEAEKKILYQVYEVHNKALILQKGNKPT